MRVNPHMIPFKKMNGLGNDFVVMDARVTPFNLTVPQIVAVADRRRGIGFDQMLVMKPSDKADFFMVVINSDGTTDTTCGNGARCVARLWLDENKKDSCTIETVVGVIAAVRAGDNIRINMGEPREGWQNMPLAEERDVKNIVFAELPDLPPAITSSIGLPHTVFFVPDAEKIDLETYGPKIELHPLFPKRTNVEFCHIVSPHHIRMRVWERGSGITEACGSGACCVLIAAVQRGLVQDWAEIQMDGGSLHIEWRPKENGGDNCVYMTGPTQLSFEGVMFPGMFDR